MNTSITHGRRVLSALTGTALALSPEPLFAGDAALTPTLEFSNGPAGTQAKLTWPAQPGVRYRVQRTDSLLPDGWSDRALVTAEGTSASWSDPEPQAEAGDNTLIIRGSARRAFYRVPEPEPEIFSVTPAVLGWQGGLLTIEGQCLPPGSSLVFDIEGQPPLTVPLLPGEAGQYRAVIPGGAVAGIVVAAVIARVQAPGGQTVSTCPHLFSITETGRATDAPPALPPGAVSVLKSKSAAGDSPGIEFTSPEPLSLALDLHFDDYEDDGSSVPFFLKAKEKANRARINYKLLQSALKREEGGRHTPFHNKYRPQFYTRGMPGEVSMEEDDLIVETPAGPPIVWTRTYRSRSGTGGVITSHPQGIYCGRNSFAALDIRIEPVPASAGVNASQVYLYSGDGRRDLLVRQPDGSFRCDGMFREGRFNPDTSFTLTFADQSKFIFCPLVGAPWQGRIGTIADANGVALSFTYSATGKLSTVSSQFGHSISCSYDGEGRLTTVTDHTGRFVSYQYYAAGETGGSEGDLKSVSCPQTPGQPPLAGPTTYTYTSGNTDDRLNHNLLSVTDGAGDLIGAWTYTTGTDPGAVDFDTCASEDFHSSGTPASPAAKIKIELSAAGYTLIRNDELGRVSECDIDLMHRCVAVRDFTGFAVPGLVTTSTTNRPDYASRVRPGDPAFFQTTFRYNADSCVTRLVHADGLEERFTYGRDLRKNCPVRERGNAHVITMRSAAGEERSVTCDYLPGFGTDARRMSGKFASAGASAPKGYARTISPLLTAWLSKKSYDYYSARSDMNASGLQNNPYFVDPGMLGGAWLSKKGYDYYMAQSDRASGGPMNNPLYEDKGGMREPILARGGRKGWDGTVKGFTASESARGRKGWDGTVKGFTAMDAARAGGGRKGWDGTIRGRPPEAFVTRMLTAAGQVFTWSYDPHGNCTASRTPVTGSGEDFTWNSLGQCTSSTILNGSDSSFVESYTYDAATSWLSSVVEDPAGLALTTQCDRDALGRVTRIVDGRGFDWLASYDTLDRITESSSPPAGTTAAARIRMRLTYTADSRLARCDMEHRDATGALDAANAAYTSWLIYDSRGRLSRIAREQRPVTPAPAESPLTTYPALDPALYAITDITYNAAGECVETRVPAASRGQSTDRVCLSYYDERNQEWKCEDGIAGAPDTITTQFDYTPAGLLSAIALMPAASAPVSEPITSSCTYDGFRRLSSSTDAMGNSLQFKYDLQGVVTISVFGELNDVAGSENNILLAKGSSRDPELIMHELTHVQQQGHGRPAPGAIVGIAVGAAVCAPHIQTACFESVVEDDSFSIERFIPGSSAPHEVETTTINRSPAGLILSSGTNGDTTLVCTYDSAGRLNTCSDGACTVSYARDACHNVILCGRTDHFRIAGTPDKTFTVFSTFDALGRCISTTDGTGNTRTVAYDSLGRGTLFTDATGVARRIRYDDYMSGTAGTPPLDCHIIVEADTDGDGEWEPLGTVHRAAGEVLRVSDTNGSITAFSRDAAGRCVQTSYPDSTHETISFDAYGRSHNIVHRDLAARNILLDANGRVLQETVTPGSPGTVPVAPTVSIYDGLGRCRQRTQGDSTLIYTWDSTGNQLSEHHNGLGVTRTFNHRGRTAITYSDGSRFQEVRDALGLLLSKSTVSAVGLMVPVTVMEYAGHRVWRETRANGVVTTHTYRADNESPLAGGGTEDFTFDECVRTLCTNGTGTVLQSTRLRRDREQNITQCDTLFGGTAQSIGRRKVQAFDRLHRLTRCTTSKRETTGGPYVVESDVTYTLNAAGFRQTASGGPDPGTYAQSSSLPPGDLQMGQYSEWPGGPLEWNDEGCLTAMTSGSVSRQLLYDAESRLVAVLGNGQTVATYAYDATGRRTRSTLAGSAVSPPVTTWFVYDGEDCIQELGGDGLPNLTIATDSRTGLCIISRNGTLVYPHGGTSSNTQGGVIRKGGKEVDKLKEEIKRLNARSRASVNTALSSVCYVNQGGVVTERLDRDDAGAPVFLTADGIVRPGATGTLNGYDWMSCIWSPRSNLYRYCPETGFFSAHGSVYSPQLGMTVAKEKPKESKPSRPREHHVGHVTLIK